MVPTEARGGRRIPWDWSYTWLRLELRSSGRVAGTHWLVALSLTLAFFLSFYLLMDVSSVLLFHPLPYSPHAEPLTEPGA